jgi:hypothetical protein
VDDTLFWARSRKAAVFRWLAALPEVSRAFPEASARLLGITAEEMRYEPKDTLKALGLTDPAFLQCVDRLFMPKFLSDEFCAADTPIAGAAEFMRKLRENGVTLAYVTGRDKPNMEAGTRAALQRNAFPLDERAVLYMKPDASADDLSFKTGVMSSIDALGAIFENEPRNLDQLSKRYPRAVPVLLDTQHSGRMAAWELQPETVIIPDYLRW